MTGLPCAGDPDGWFRTDPASVQAAKAGCGGCPARDRCLQLALAESEQHGVWGGLTPAERADLDRQPDELFAATRVEVQVDHSRAAYVAGVHGDCARCRAANAAFKAQWLAERTSVTPPEASPAEQLDLFGRTA
ncbi:WhiB family transcriptional regulator [Blastococcus sp. SYSU D00813]